MSHYKYTDNISGKTIFVVQAKDVLDADKKLKYFTGIDASKKPNIGCNITAK